MSLHPVALSLQPVVHYMKMAVQKSLVFSFNMGSPRLLRLEITGDASTNGSVRLGVSMRDLAVT